ncbi:hypothetical protein PUN28_010200 [Cardiocondyla obscurior]|uniref:Uncharacterized protein n=1 Tax=Cardiocondyla obscurior TaxID=286306 RepID=A0AAW2FTI1_9HYME
MFAVRNGLRNSSHLPTIIARTYSNTIVSAPPEVKMSTAEKIISLICISGSIFVTPMYMVPNFKNYAKK